MHPSLLQHGNSFRSDPAEDKRLPKTAAHFLAKEHQGVERQDSKARVLK